MHIAVVGDRSPHIGSATRTLLKDDLPSELSSWSSEDVLFIIIAEGHLILAWQGRDSTGCVPPGCAIAIAQLHLPSCRRGAWLWN